MLPVLVLAHAVLGAAVILTRGLPDVERSRLVQAASVLGAAFAVALLLTRGAEVDWGSVSMKPGPAAVAAAAIFCAWLLVAAVDDGKGRWDLAALVGAAATALAMFALSDWVAPALLFWVCVGGAFALVAHGAGGLGSAGVAIGVSDVLVVGALVAWAQGEGTWRMPERLSGWVLAVAVCGLALRAGLLPRTGAWERARGAEVAFVPLLIGSVFALVPSLSVGQEVWVALPLLLIGIVTALWCLLGEPKLRLGATWAVATMLSLVWVAPAALGKAAAAAALAATMILLWPWTGGRAAQQRGFIVAAVPLTAGFGAIVGGAMASFERATGTGSVLAAVPWSAFAALLPAGLAIGVMLGAAIGRRVEPESFHHDAVVVSWAITAAAVVLGLSAGPELAFSVEGDVWLYSSAALVAAAAAYLTPPQPIWSDIATSAPSETVATSSPTEAVAAGKAAVALVGAAFVAVLLFTYSGLRVGFL